MCSGEGHASSTMPSIGGASGVIARATALRDVAHPGLHRLRHGRLDRVPVRDPVVLAHPRRAAQQRDHHDARRPFAVGPRARPREPVAAVLGVDRLGDEVARDVVARVAQQGLVRRAVVVAVEPDRDTRRNGCGSSAGGGIGTGTCASVSSTCSDRPRGPRARSAGASSSRAMRPASAGVTPARRPAQVLELLHGWDSRAWSVPRVPAPDPLAPPASGTRPRHWGRPSGGGRRGSSRGDPSPGGECGATRPRSGPGCAR